MDIFSEQIMKNVARKATEEYERKKRLDPNYKPTSRAKLILWPVSIAAVVAIIFFVMAR